MNWALPNQVGSEMGNDGARDNLVGHCSPLRPEPIASMHSDGPYRNFTRSSNHLNAKSHQA